jgi:hypothetical protein
MNVNRFRAFRPNSAGLLRREAGIFRGFKACKSAAKLGIFSESASIFVPYYRWKRLISVLNFLKSFILLVFRPYFNRPTPPCPVVNLLFMSAKTDLPSQVISPPTHYYILRHITDIAACSSWPLCSSLHTDFVSPSCAISPTNRPFQPLNTAKIPLRPIYKP